MKEPAIGDVIKFKNYETGFFSTLKINSITKDSIFVIPNNYETDKKNGIAGIDIVKNYSTEPYSLGKDEVKAFFDQGVFYDIER